jgi:1,4-alpha-glucan branching enzyme
MGDTFGIVAVEALSAGVPVITTNVHAMTEIVTDGVEGEIIRIPTNSFGVLTDYSPAIEDHIRRELIRILTDLIENPEKRRTMSQNASRKWEQKFSAKRCARDLIELYHTALEGHADKGCRL